MSVRYDIPRLLGMFRPVCRSCGERVTAGKPRRGPGDQWVVPYECCSVTTEHVVRGIEMAKAFASGSPVAFIEAAAPTEVGWRPYPPGPEVP